MKPEKCLRIGLGSSALSNVVLFYQLPSDDACGRQ